MKLWLTIFLAATLAGLVCLWIADRELKKRGGLAKLLFP